ncbi:hypothetical protein LSH36_185g05013 [Paralvinella palmiformis]|uniref:Cytosolic endo-beta-N-acetylglucosaminidase TIM barrel domain-containing protein n=1 Tax=Paralvinella palmiformis TaxID=53620 RepID=A0AAD9JRA2_9ANNE|nr:hypothetical protein LSH36_185g05013 [Paralvinella palmiformis]
MKGNRMFMHTDEASQQPIIQPLKSMTEVERWKPGFDLLCTASIPLKHRKVELPSRPRTLLCHDMKGGYLEDRFVQGVKTTDCYRFYYWCSVDVFVYFSHYFVTIPPPAWINAGHTNGVLVLGTLITEWDSGKDICETFLSSDATRRYLVNKLVAIASYYNFDGWLINIENEISEINVPKLIRFVKELTEAMKDAISSSLVIWYDSVTVTGKLEWQNELNSNNKQYFDVVMEFSKLCGGGYNTIEAVQDARVHGLSIALFGPGWAFEKFGNENFLENEKQFWELVNVGCSHRYILCLPFASAFCQGWGNKLHVTGEVVAAKAWTNMSQQYLQPIGPQPGLTYDQDMVFCGGGSLRLTCTETEKSVNTFKLFDTAIPISEGSTIFVSYTYNTNSGVRSALMIELFSDQRHYLIMSTGYSEDLFIDASPYPANCISIEHLTDDHKPQFILEGHPGSAEKWKTDWFKWHPTGDYQIQSVSLLLQCNGPYTVPNSLCLGSLRLLTPKDLQLPAVSSLRAIDISSRFSDNNIAVTTSLTLTWKCDLDMDYFIPYYEDDDQWVVLGPTSTPVFRICNLVLRRASCRFKIQGIYCGGASIPLESAPSILVIFEQNSYSISSST